jgi:hypothetical protein
MVHFFVKVFVMPRYKMTHQPREVLTLVCTRQNIHAKYLCSVLLHRSSLYKLHKSCVVQKVDPVQMRRCEEVAVFYVFIFMLFSRLYILYFYVVIFIFVLSLY